MKLLNLKTKLIIWPTKKLKIYIHELPFPIYVLTVVPFAN